MSLLLRYLDSFAVNGLALAVVVVPRTSTKGDLESFCVPARVITEEEWVEVSGEQRGLDEAPPDDPSAVVARRAVGVLLNSWLRRDRLRVVIKGEPGEGKTTSLWLYIAQMCRDAMSALHEHRKPLRMPIILPLKLVRAGGPSLVQQAIEHSTFLAEPNGHNLEATRKSLERCAARGEVTLFLDALDEMPELATSWVRSQVLECDRFPVVLTTRYHADPSAVLAEYKVLRLVPLRWWLVDAFISKYFANLPRGQDLAADLRAQLRQSPALRNLSRNPFLLALMCQLGAAEGQAALPATRSGLLRSALLGMQGRRAQYEGGASAPMLSPEQKLEVLAQVACAFQRDRPVPMDETSLLSVLDGAVRVVAPTCQPMARALLKDFVADGILVRRGTGPYNFLLRLFHEYFVASYIARRLEGGRSLPQALGRGGATDPLPLEPWGDIRPLNQPGWREVWPLLAGCLHRNDALVDLLVEERKRNEDVTHSRLRLLAHVLGEFLESNRHERSIQEKWQGILTDVVHSIALLCGEEPSVTGIPGSWRYVLASLPPRASIPVLCSRLDSRMGPGDPSAYALALGEIGTPDAVLKLGQFIANEATDEVHRANAAVALGLVGDTDARDALIRLLDQEPTRRQYLLYGCLSGLSHVGDATSAAKITSFLSGTGILDDAMLQCIEACGPLYGPDIEDTLLNLATSCANQLHLQLAPKDVGRLNERISKCAEVLGRIGGSSTTGRLLGLLERPLAENAKRALCLAIAETGDIGGREKLVAILRSPNVPSNLATYAALALVQVGDARTLQELISVGGDPRLAVHLRLEVVSACQHGGAPKAVEFLCERLANDPDPSVKLAAAKGLGRVGAAFATLVLRDVLATSKQPELRLACALSLAKQGHDDGEQTLLVALEHHVMALAEMSAPARHALAPTPTLADVVDALSQGTSERARNALARHASASETPDRVRTLCLHGLSRLQREHGWRALQNGGWDSP